MSKDIPLTTLDREFNEMVRLTPSGMAHWATTGPKGTTCRECTNFEKPEYKDDMLRVSKCRMYRVLSYREGKPVPHETPSCKFFEWNDNPPPIMKKKLIIPITGAKNG